VLLIRSRPARPSRAGTAVCAHRSRGWAVPRASTPVRACQSTCRARRGVG